MKIMIMKKRVCKRKMNRERISKKKKKKRNKYQMILMLILICKKILW